MCCWCQWYADQYPCCVSHTHVEREQEPLLGSAFSSDATTLAKNSTVPECSANVCRLHGSPDRPHVHLPPIMAAAQKQFRGTVPPCGHIVRDGNLLARQLARKAKVTELELAHTIAQVGCKRREGPAVTEGSQESQGIHHYQHGCWIPHLETCNSRSPGDLVARHAALSTASPDG